MRTFLTVSLCALALGLATGVARAETSNAGAPPEEAAGGESGDFARKAIYVGFEGLAAVDDGFDGPESGGLGLHVGWRLHPHVALEGTYQYYQDLDVDDTWSTTFNVKPYILTGRWQPFVVAGLGYLDQNSGGEFVLRCGAGLDANINENWAVGPEIAYLIEPDSGDGFLTFAFGVTYKATAD